MLALVHTNGTRHVPFLLVLFVGLPCNLSCFPTVWMDDFLFPTDNFSFQSFRLKDRTHTVRYFKLTTVTKSSSQNTMSKRRHTRDEETGQTSSKFQQPSFPHAHPRRDLFRNLQWHYPTQGAHPSQGLSCVSLKQALRLARGAGNPA